MKRIGLLLFMLSLAVSLAAQKKQKLWVEWSQKDAEKILNDSPWGKTQTDTDLAQMFYTAGPSGVMGATRRSGDSPQGDTNQATPVKLYIRFLSARPIRQAFVRLMELKNPSTDPALAERLQAFATAESKDWIFVAVAFAANDQRASRPLLQLFNTLNTGTLKNVTYLERKDGKRLFLHEYSPPGADGMGAKFSFPRVVDGQPFISEDADEVRFHSELQSKAKIDMKFKLAEMKYNDQLEY